MLNSKRLKAFFEEHPGDLALLQHDKPLAKANSAPHLKHIPAYLRDPTVATPSFAGNAGKGDAQLLVTAFSKCCMAMNLLSIFGATRVASL